MLRELIRNSSYALDVAGANGGVIIPNSPSLNPTDYIALEFNVFMKAGIACNLADNSQSGVTNSYYCFVDGQGLMYWYSVIGGVGVNIIGAKAPYFPNAYNKYGFKYDGTKVELYANGELVARVYASGALGTNSQVLRLGQHWTGATVSESKMHTMKAYHTNQYNFNDHIRFYNNLAPRAIIESTKILDSNTQIGSGTSVPDLSSSGNNGTFTRASWTTEVPFKSRTVVPLSENIFKQSENFLHADWGYSGVLTAGAAANPVNGAMNAFQLTDILSSVTAFQILQVMNSDNMPLNSPYCVSIFAKKPVGSTNNYLAFTIGISSTRVSFDLTNGTVAFNVGWTSAGVIDLGNGWYRCWASTTVTGGPALVNFSTVPTASAYGYTGTGTGSVYLYGAQLTKTNYVAPYLANTTSSPLLGNLKLKASGKVLATNRIKVIDVADPENVTRLLSSNNYVLEGWYRADSILGNDGDLITTVNDLSGLGNHIVAPSSSFRPTLYTTNASHLLNGLPTLFFNGTNSLKCASGFAGQPRTIFLIGRSNIEPTLQVFLDGNTAISMALFRLSFNYRINAGTHLGFIGSNGTAWNVLSGIFNSTQSMCGVNQTEVFGNAGSNSQVGITVGAAGDNTLGLNGNIAEVIIVRGVVDPFTRRMIRAYLNAKYLI